MRKASVISDRGFALVSVADKNEPPKDNFSSEALV